MAAPSHSPPGDRGGSAMPYWSESRAAPVARLDACHDLHVGAGVEQGQLAANGQRRGAMVHLAEHVAHEGLVTPPADQHRLRMN